MMKEGTIAEERIYRGVCRMLTGVALAVFLVPLGAWAAPLTFEGAQGSLGASATFDVNGSNLVVTLRNSSANDVMVPADVLTGLFFDIAGSPGLTQQTAVLAPGAQVHFGSTDAGGGVGGEWAYRQGLAGAPGSTSYGISSSGLGLFGPGDLFLGSNLDGPRSPGGLEYGILSAGDNVGTGNRPVTGKDPLIQDAVIFTLGGVPDNLSPSDISNVQFQYGTDLSEPSFGGNPSIDVPEPGTMLLLAAGAAFLVAKARRLRR